MAATLRKRVLVFDVGTRNLGVGLFELVADQGQLHAGACSVVHLENFDFLKEGGCEVRNSHKIPGARIFKLLLDVLMRRRGGLLAKPLTGSPTALAYGVDAVVVERQPGRGQTLANIAFVISTFFDTLFRLQGAPEACPEIAVQHAGTKFMLQATNPAGTALSLTEEHRGGRRGRHEMLNAGDHGDNKKLAEAMGDAFFTGLAQTAAHTALLNTAYWPMKRRHDMADTFLLAAFYTLQCFEKTQPRSQPARQKQTETRKQAPPENSRKRARKEDVEEEEEEDPKKNTKRPRASPKKRKIEETLAAPVAAEMVFDEDGEQVIDLTHL